MMREPTFLILTALTAEPLHGYALIQRVADLSENQVRLKPGSLYGTLDRLLEEGAIVRTGREVVDGRTRHYYALSPGGEDALAQRASQLRRHLAHATQGLRARGVRVA